MNLLDSLLQSLAQCVGPVRPSLSRSRQLGFVFVGRNRGLFGGKKFTPRTVFISSGANGAWLDYSDFNSEFQDSAGTTPVTAVEQPIGLVLDKHLGAIRGPELTTNGDNEAALVSGPLGPLSTAAGATTVRSAAPGGGFAAQVVGTGASAPHECFFQLATNKTYEIRARFYVPTGGIATAKMFDVDDGSWFSQTSVVKDQWVTLTGVRTAKALSWNIAFGDNTPSTIANGVTAFYVDDISIKEVAGNHVSQPTAASRPVVSARVNLLNASTGIAANFISNGDAGWQDNFGIAPDGTTTTTLTTTGGTRYSPLTLPANSQAVHSIHFRKAAGKVGRVYVDGAGVFGGSALVDFDLGTLTQVTSSGAFVSLTLISVGQFVRASMVFNTSATGGLAAFHVFPVAGYPVEVWGVSASIGSVIPVYQGSRTATSYDTAGFPLYAALNGTNSTLASTTGGGGTAGFFFCQAITPKSRGTTLTTPVNAAFATALTGGTLAAGTYFYRVTAINAYGETLASTETSQVTTGTTSTVTVNWGAVSGATGYKIYGRTTGAELALVAVNAVTAYIDTGAVTSAGALPAANTTAYMVILSDATGNSGFTVALNYLGNPVLRAGNGTTFTTATSTDVAALGTASLITLTDDGTNLGAQLNSGAVFTVPRPVVSAGTAAFTIGSDNGAATGFFNGNLYPEVYGQNTAFTALQRSQIQAYCRSRAGL